MQQVANQPIGKAVQLGDWLPTQTQPKHTDACCNQLTCKAMHSGYQLATILETQP